MDRGGRLRADDIIGVTRVFGICFTFAGEGMKGNGLVSDVVHGGGMGNGQEGRGRRGQVAVYNAR